MCRVVAYLGRPLPLEHVLFETDNSLVAQVYGARMAGTYLSLAGFGMARRVQILVRLGGRTGPRWAGAALVCCEWLRVVSVSGERRGVG